MSEVMPPGCSGKDRTKTYLGAKMRDLGGPEPTNSSVILEPSFCLRLFPRAGFMVIPVRLHQVLTLKRSRQQLYSCCLKVLNHFF